MHHTLTQTATYEASHTPPPEAADVTDADGKIRLVRPSLREVLEETESSVGTPADTSVLGLQAVVRKPGHDNKGSKQIQTTTPINPSLSEHLQDGATSLMNGSKPNQAESGSKANAE